MIKCLLYYKIWKFSDWKFHGLIVGSSSINIHEQIVCSFTEKFLFLYRIPFKPRPLFSFYFICSHWNLRYENMFWKRKVPRFHASSRVNQNVLKRNFFNRRYLYLLQSRRKNDKRAKYECRELLELSAYIIHLSTNSMRITAIENSFVKAYYH